MLAPALSMEPESGARPEVRARGAAPKPLMWITPGRVFYSGLLGRPSVRRIGGIIVYVAQQEPIGVSIEGGAWVQADLIVVPAYTPHRVACEARTITDLIVEPETVAPLSLPAFMRDARGAVHAPEFVQHVRATLAKLRGCNQALPLDDATFDSIFFGTALRAAKHDARIAKVLADITQDPAGTTSAADHAASVHLSFSRFLHLFKSEAGVSLRPYRGWKRARSMLGYVTHNANLADIAQHTGYPDSSHFSHSIRQVFGLTPKDVFAGCRTMELHGQLAAVTVARRGVRSRVD
jgi:methylphosphotriester-DNA--protein-cysteine methyltransferase